MKVLLRALPGIALLAAVLAGWSLAAQVKLVNPLWFPGPERTAGVLAEWVRSGELWDPLCRTTLRMFGGWLVAALVGTAAGAAIASSRRAHALLSPSAEFLRPLPASAMLPPAVLVLGMGDTMIVAVVAFGCLWPVLLGAIHGFRSLDPRLADVADTLGIHGMARALKFSLPGALPDIFAGLRVSISIALIITVAAEMLSSQAGVGYMMLVASRSFRSADIFAGIAVLGVLGFATNAATQALENRLLRWRPAQAGT